MAVPEETYANPLVKKLVAGLQERMFEPLLILADACEEVGYQRWADGFRIMQARRMYPRCSTRGGKVIWSWRSARSKNPLNLSCLPLSGAGHYRRGFGTIMLYGAIHLGQLEGKK